MKWKNLEPNVFRKRLVIEAKFDAVLTKELIETYLRTLTKKLGMHIIFGPLVHPFARGYNPDECDGFEGLLIWGESGVSFYSWERYNFLTVDIYTCKDFDNKTAIEYTREVFKTKEIVWKEV